MKFRSWLFESSAISSDVFHLLASLFDGNKSSLLPLSDAFEENGFANIAFLLRTAKDGRPKDRNTLIEYNKTFRSVAYKFRIIKPSRMRIDSPDPNFDKYDFFFHDIRGSGSVMTRGGTVEFPYENRHFVLDNRRGNKIYYVNWKLHGMDNVWGDILRKMYDEGIDVMPIKYRQTPSTGEVVYYASRFVYNTDEVTYVRNATAGEMTPEILMKSLMVILSTYGSRDLFRHR